MSFNSILDEHTNALLFFFQRQTHLATSEQFCCKKKNLKKSRVSNKSNLPQVLLGLRFFCTADILLRGAVLYVVGCIAASLPNMHKLPAAHSCSHANQNCLPKLPNVPQKCKYHPNITNHYHVTVHSTNLIYTVFMQQNIKNRAYCDVTSTVRDDKTRLNHRHVT